MKKSEIDRFEKNGVNAVYQSGVACGGQRLECWKIRGEDEVMLEYSSPDRGRVFKILADGKKLWEQIYTEACPRGVGLSFSDYGDGIEDALKMGARALAEKGWWELHETRLYPTRPVYTVYDVYPCEED